MLEERILLSFGGGGEETRNFINNLILKYFSNSILEKLEDSAVISLKGKTAFTTDAFTVKPLFFKGGNIGKLAITGTINDLAVMGAKPLYIGVSFVIEEGFLIEDFEKILKSMQEECKKNQVQVVAGDTKVVPRGEVDGIFITTSGIGEIIYSGISCTSIQKGDIILVSGSIGEHGACVLSERQGIGMDVEIKSDCESLWPLLELLFKENLEIHALRDPTRGGLSAVLYEWAYSSGVSILIEESKVPVKPQVKAFCEALGFEPYHLPCEGRFVMALPENHAEKALFLIRSHPSGKYASIIGKVLEKTSHPKVILKTLYETERIMEPSSGELLPRIC